MSIYELAVIGKEDCPNCKIAFRDRTFRDYLRLLRKIRQPVRVIFYDVDDPDDYNEVVVKYVGTTVKERLLYEKGYMRGTPKTLSLYFTDGKGRSNFDIIVLESEGKPKPREVRYFRLVNFFSKVLRYPMPLIVRERGEKE